MSEWQMTMGWGVIGSRSQTMPLYFDRPVGSGGSQPQFAEKASSAMPVRILGRMRRSWR